MDEMTGGEEKVGLKRRSKKVSEKMEEQFIVCFRELKCFCTLKFIAARPNTEFVKHLKFNVKCSRFHCV